MIRVALGLTLASAAPSVAAPVPKSTRIAAVAAWRYTPNETFARHAAENGSPLSRPIVGGPGVNGIFAYQASERLELALEVGFFVERFQSGDWPSLWLHSAPLAAVLRVGIADWGRVSFYLGGGAALLLNFWTGGPDGFVEAHALSPVAVAGVSIRLTDEMALVVEDRQTLARSTVPGLGPAQVGGNALGIGWVVSFPPEQGVAP